VRLTANPWGLVGLRHNYHDRAGKTRFWYPFLYTERLGTQYGRIHNQHHSVSTLTPSLVSLGEINSLFFRGFPTSVANKICHWILYWGASGCSFVFCKNGPNACIFYWTRKIRLKQGVDKVFKNLFSDQVEVVKWITVNLLNVKFLRNTGKLVHLAKFFY